jgi:hypothetical protein
MSLKLNSSGGGSLTLQEPVTASTLTLNLPATLGNTGNSMQVTSDASGNVGLGVTPSAWGGAYKALQIGDTGCSVFTANSIFLLNNAFNNGTNWIYQGSTGSGVYEINRANSSHIWYNAPSGTAGNAITFTPAMTLTAAGDLLVGATTKYSAGLPGNVVQINGSSNGGLVIGNGTSNIAMYRDLANNITYWFNGSNQASLTAAGTWTNASDAKLKKEITTIKYGLDTVLLTQPRSYKRIDVEGEYIGFVAQELKEQIPEVVFGSETVQYSVDYGSLVAVAFKAIQELKAELDTVKAELAVLKGTT